MQARTLRAIGYWRDADGVPTDLPDVRSFVDATWDQRERLDVFFHLRDGQFVRAWMGTSTCRLCGRSNGSRDQSDGVYLWPEGLAHYVEVHSVRLPAEFVAHVQEHADQEVEVDHAWWRGARIERSTPYWTICRLELTPDSLERRAELPRLDGLLSSTERRALSDSGVAPLEAFLRSEEEIADLLDALLRAGFEAGVVYERVAVPEQLCGPRRG